MNLVSPSWDSLPAHSSSFAPRRVAVILNGNARAVTESLIRDFSGVLGNEALYVSGSLEQSKFIARQVVKKSYDVVLCGGGDGTFSQCVSDILALRPARPPIFGILRLGTGNALATSLGASPATAEGLAADLALARQPVLPFDCPILTVEGRLCPFAGLGLDALILNDYNSVKDTVRGTPLGSFTEGPVGYALAIATRSLWRLGFQPRPWVTIRNDGAPTQRLDLRGRPIGPVVARGEILYQGPVTIAAASSVPYYGLGLRLFPHALRRTDRFHLRIGDVPAAYILARLPALFRGQLDHPGIFDYLCSAVSIQVREPTPVQAGGDEVGFRSALRMGMTQIKTLRRDVVGPLWDAPSASSHPLDAALMAS